MPAPKSSPSARSKSSSGSRSSNRSGASKRAAGSSRAKRTARPTANAAATTADASTAAPSRAGLAGVIEQLTNGIIRPLDLVMLSHQRIQDTLDEAAARGRLTRSDANDLVSELVRRGRQQTDDLLSDLDDLLGRGREQIGSATKRTRIAEPVERLARGAGRVRRTVSAGNPTVSAGPSLPIVAYDDMTARQVEARLTGLGPAELRKVRDYERRHANRKSVLAAVEKQLA